jgi:hypothetical protein
MTILLLFLLVLYFAVVSAPISIRLVRLVFARDRSSELPQLQGSTVVRSGAPKGGVGAAAKWSRRYSRATIRKDAHVQGGKS